MSVNHSEKYEANGEPVSPTDTETTVVADSKIDLESGTEKKRRSWSRSFSWPFRSHSSSAPSADWYKTKTRSLDDSPKGYSQVAPFQSSDRNFLQYRGFSYLHSRLLSGLQCDVECLERELDKLDRWDKSDDGEIEKLSSKQLDDQEDSPESVPGDFQFCHKRTRPELLRELKTKLMDYDEVLLKTKEMAALQRPSRKDYESVRDWFYDQKPLIDQEAEYMWRKEDIVTLRSGRECAGFDGFVEIALSRLDKFLIKKFGCQVIRRMFMTPELAEKTKDKRLNYYEPKRIDKLVNGIIAFMIFVLMVLPVVAMYKLSDMGQRNSPFEAIGMLIIFTLLFGFAMSTLTKATRQELFAASAAYCAVLVVFISNFSPQTVSVSNLHGGSIG